MIGRPVAGAGGRRPGRQQAAQRLSEGEGEEMKVLPRGYCYR